MQKHGRGHPLPGRRLRSNLPRGGPSLGHGSGISANKARIAVGKIKREEVRLLFNTTNHHHGLAKIRLGMTRGMCQRHKHLTASTTMFTNVILDRRVAALEPVLIPQPLKNTLGGMPLLAVPVEVFLKPLVDEADETIQLGPLDLSRTPIAPSRACKHALPGSGAAPKNP